MAAVPVSAQGNLLVLTESGRRVLSADVVVQGGILSPRGRQHLFWSGDTVWIASSGDPALHPICPEIVRAPLGAAFVGDDLAAAAPAIEILDGGAEGVAELRLITFSGGECRATTWSAPDSSRLTARAPGGWVFVAGTASGGHTDASRTRVTLRRASGDPFLPPVIELQSRWSDSAAVSLSGTPGGVTVSSRLFPFAWSTVAEDGGPGASGRIPAGNETYYASDPWVGTGVFALDSGFVQVLADLASDRRHLVFYDSSGAFRRRRVIDVPFGILDTAPDRRQLLALRRTDRVEILTYEWTWQPHRARKKKL